METARPVPIVLRMLGAMPAQFIEAVRDRNLVTIDDPRAEIARIMLRLGGVTRV